MLNKYVQFFRDNGFFAGSKIKAQITDSSYIGKEITLSKGAEVLQTQTVPANGKVEFFTDDSGELTLSSDNGISVISGTVEVRNYATYNVTLDGAYSDITREVYPDKESIAFDLSTSSDTVKFAYTGDKANATASSNNSEVATASVKNNVVTVTKANNEMDGNCVIAVTIPSTSKYQQKSFNINVSKQGRVGSWADASNETLVNMVSAADRGELNLRDYWSVGDTRIVTIQSISPLANSVMNVQPQQQIELVLLYDSISDTKYELVEETISHRNRPSFVVGLKNCLENLSPIDYEVTNRTLTTAYSSYVTYERTVQMYKAIKDNGMTKLDTWLNENFYNALPSSISSLLKTVKVVYNALNSDTYEYGQNSENNATSWFTKKGVKNQKIALPSAYELAGHYVSKSHASSASFFSWAGNSTGNSVYGSDARFYKNVAASFEYPKAESAEQYESEGTYYSYYNTTDKRKKKRGINGDFCKYYTRSSAEFFSSSVGNISDIKYQGNLMSNAIIAENGRVDKVPKADYASTYAGISPIMFI